MGERPGAMLVHVLFSGRGVFCCFCGFFFPLGKCEGWHCTHSLEGLGNAVLPVSSR